MADGSGTTGESEGAVDGSDRPDLPSVVSSPNVDLPAGYEYAVTRYADLVFREAFPDRFQEFVEVLDEYRIHVDELVKGGGARASMTARFDDGLARHGWGKRNIAIARLIDGKPLHVTRGHEIDMFATAPGVNPYPGIGVEMEWNNKDPFYDRDLLNFQALHREGALAVGIIVTRGPRLQELIGPVIRTGPNAGRKYGQASTHWRKLIPRVNLGGGGECPLLLVGIEPERVDGIEIVRMAYENQQTLY